MNPRLRRLQADYELVREMFSGHPHVFIEPVGGRLPPESYRVEFRLRGLYLKGNRPDYRDLHTVEIMLPRSYPAVKPYVVPLAPIFHPNIREFFCIADHWAAGTTLADVVAKLGDMIQWRVYNAASPLDPIAARWAIEQEPTGLFPIDDVELGVADVDVKVVTEAPPAPQDAPSLAALGAARNGLPEIIEPAAVEDRELVLLLRPQAPSGEAQRG
jgi:ubiquitin-protein ligase